MATATSQTKNAPPIQRSERAQAPAASPPTVRWQAPVGQTVTDPVAAVTIAVNTGGHVVAAYESTAGSIWAAGGTWTSLFPQIATFHLVDKGTAPSIAINSRDQVVLVYQNASTDLICRLGTWRSNSIEWETAPHQYESGVEPSIAINFDGCVVEAHRSQNRRSLHYNVGQLESGRIKFFNDHGINYDGGQTPSIALNDRGAVVEYHRSQFPGDSGLFYHLGTVDGSKIDGLKRSAKGMGKGSSPDVAINNAGDVVLGYISNDSVQRMKPGIVDGDSIRSNPRQDLVLDMKSSAVGMSLGQAAVAAIAGDGSDQIWVTSGILEP